MKLNFRLLTLQDKELVLKYTWNGDRQNCDLTFANLYSWHFLYHTEMAEWGGFLIFRFNVDGHLAYMFPIGEGDWDAVIHLMQADACAHEKPFLIQGVCKDFVSKVHVDRKDGFVLTNNRDHADYIYLRESLVQLNGKKLQPKRNHVNKFTRLYPDYEYLPLVPEMIPQCLSLVRQWGDEKLALNEQRAVQSEAYSIERALTHMPQLDILGGALFVAGQMIAFTYGAPINKNTFDVCVEKADTTFEGAYAVINKEFAAHLPEQYVYVNREEDLGLEGLRKAKLSYQPFLVLEKYSLWSACSIKHLVEERIHSCCDLHIKWQTRALWKLCFGDSEEFIHLYFAKKYTDQLNSYILFEGKLIAALQRLPYQMNVGGKEVGVAYISGACTHPDYRGKGVMQNLLKEAHTQMRSDGMVWSVLIPANVGLFDYYARSGYSTPPPSCCQQIIQGVVSEQDSFLVESYLSNGSWNKHEVFLFLDRKLRAVPYALLHSVSDFEVILEDLFLARGVICVSRNKENEINGLLFARQAEGRLQIMELFSDSFAIANALQQKAMLSLQLPQDAPVLHVCNKPQVRVVDAERALCAYAETYPRFSGIIRVVGDDAIFENNGFYALQAGECKKLSSPACCTESLKADVVKNINELSDFLFSSVGPYLSLMLN